MKTLPIAAQPAQFLRKQPWIRLAVVVAVFGFSTVVMNQVRSPQAELVTPLTPNLDAIAPPETLRLPVSLPNGADLQSPAGNTGHSLLTIDNSNSADAVAKLVDRETGRTVRFVYVRANQKVTLEGLGVGLYDLKFALGVDWDETQQRFRRNQSLSVFSEPLEFIVAFEGNQELWRTYEVTLHPVLYGTAQAEPIDESEF
ncbi:hypothetical protein IQ254_11085 [Nodosilinea sp. LEGE 07088]|uniref:hypothetical protein n=1 Tax=Nodosilinea sp. LEGE 07088 TaxID=2777968 RepID=UPI00187DF8A3|nr:hypothetical protein [Nodosilinea sp. LEGE 07088]MBE9137729.1 hypothetical protein [Nodosilinea sp. LEGE 07088]